MTWLCIHSYETWKHNKRPLFSLNPVLHKEGSSERTLYTERVLFFWEVTVFPFFFWKRKRYWESIVVRKLLYLLALYNIDSTFESMLQTCRLMLQLDKYIIFFIFLGWQIQSLYHNRKLKEFKYIFFYRIIQVWKMIIMLCYSNKRNSTLSTNFSSASQISLIYFTRSKDERQDNEVVQNHICKLMDKQI